MTLSLPSASLNLATLDNEFRMDAWRDFNRGVFQVEPNPMRSGEFEAEMIFYKVASLIFGEIRHNGTILSSNDKTARNGEEYVVLRVHRTGKLYGTINDRAVELSPATVSLLDSQLPGRAEATPVDYVSLTIPYSAIGYDPSRFPGLMQVAAQSPAGRLLVSNLEMVLGMLPTASIEQANRMADGVIGLLRGLISRKLREESSAGQHAGAIEIGARQFLRENIRDPRLDADWICQSIGVSRPTLYRIFQPDGGVQRLITHQRMQAAYRELRFCEPKHGIVGSVAETWGFHDPGHFSRLFKELFGVRPTEVVGSDLVNHEVYPLPSAPGIGSSNAQELPLVALYGGHAAA